MIAIAFFLVSGCATSPGNVAYRYTGAEYAHPAVSPDGRHVAVDVHDHDTQRHHAELLALDGSARKRVGTSAYFGDWSPDGQGAVLVEAGRLSLITTAASPAGPAQTLSRHDLDGQPRFARWLPGNHGISYSVCTDWWMGKTCTGGNIMSLPLTGGAPQVAVPDADPFQGAGPLWSPDGRLIAYRRFSEHTQCRRPDCIAEIAVPIRLRSSESRAEHTLPGGIPFTWTPDGKEIWFIKSRLDRIESIAGHRIPSANMAQLASATADGMSTKILLELGEGLTGFRFPNFPARNWDPSGTRMGWVTPRGLVVLDRDGRMIADHREACGVGTSKQQCDVYDPNISWMPGGETIMFVRRQSFPESTGGGVKSGVYALDVGTGTVSLVAGDTLQMVGVR